MSDWYVDFSAANNGDGTDGAQAGSPAGVGAWNQFTASELASVSAGDVVWFRRTASGSKKSITVGNGSQVGGRIQYNGWPVNNSDEHYDQAQATANTVKATWDSDPDTYCVANPVGSTPSYQYVTFRRIHWEELGGGNNYAFEVTSGTMGEFRFYECKADKAGPLPRIRSGSSAFGRCAWDRVDVKGTAPNFDAVRTDGTTGMSAYVRVRVTMTDGGSSGFKVWDDGSGGISGYYCEILDWVDAGTHYLEMENGIGCGDHAWIFTTDDDNVGVLPLYLNQGNMFFSGRRVLMRNVTLNHALQIPTSSVITGWNAETHVYLENFEFHPTDHTNQVQCSTSGRLAGRNIRNFDPSKVTNSNEGVDDRGAFSSFVHFSQINDTEAWYRRMHGSVAQLSDVNRTGGAANGILVETFERDISLQDRGLANGVFYSEEFGLEGFAFVKTGLSYPAALTFTAYFAVLHWDGLEDAQAIWFELELYKNAAASDYTRKIIDSRKLPPTQNFISDGSTWNNITGETAYRVEIPVTVVKDDIIKVRFGVRDTYEDAGMQRNLVVFDPAMTLA